MIVRRLLSGVLLLGLAAPTLAAAPHAREPRAQRAALPALPAPPAGGVSRVFARAEGDPVPAPGPDDPAALPAAATPSPEVAARARAEFEAHRSGKIDRARYTAGMSARIDDAALAAASAQLKPLGAVKAFTQVRKITQGTLTLYVFRVECEKPPVMEQAIAWNPAGKVNFLRFEPAR